jgi:hypothetical protein
MAPEFSLPVQGKLNELNGERKPTALKVATRR